MTTSKRQTNKRRSKSNFHPKKVLRSKKNLSPFAGSGPLPRREPRACSLRRFPSCCGWFPCDESQSQTQRFVLREKKTALKKKKSDKQDGRTSFELTLQQLEFLLQKKTKRGEEKGKTKTKKKAIFSRKQHQHTMLLIVHKQEALPPRFFFSSTKLFSIFDLHFSPQNSQQWAASKKKTKQWANSPRKKERVFLRSPFFSARGGRSGRGARLSHQSHQLMNTLGNIGRSFGRRFEKRNAAAKDKKKKRENNFSLSLTSDWRRLFPLMSAPRAGRPCRPCCPPTPQKLAQSSFSAKQKKKKQKKKKQNCQNTKNPQIRSFSLTKKREKDNSHFSLTWMCVRSFCACWNVGTLVTE